MIQERNSANAVGGPIHHTVLDAIVKGIFGTPPEEMTQAEGAQAEKKASNKRADAYNMAKEAATGENRFMGPPDVGSGGLNIGKLLGAVASIFG